MSFGDELMAAGQAERHWRETGRQVCIVGRDNRPRWSDLWAGNPAIVRKPGAGVDTIRNGPGCRPYLHYPWSRQSGARFTDWRADEHRATLYLSDTERAAAATLRSHVGGDYVVVEPNLARDGNPNKAWPYWQELADALREIGTIVVQPGAPGARALDGIVRVETASFRYGAAVLAGAKAAILPEGGLHHAAAALRIPAVVIFGGHTPVETTGYSGHVNIGRAPACGKWMPCEHCRAAMASITVKEVLDALDRL